MKHKRTKLMLLLLLLCSTGFVCSKNKCHTAILTFNNNRNDTITVLVYTKGEKEIAPGAHVSFNIRLHFTLPYDVSDYSGKLLIESEITMASCISKEINIEE